jgi:outer membrane lipoprotein LolB
LRVETAEPTSFFASFELSGQAQAGELTLSSPMGTTLAQLRWSPQYALLRSDGRTRAFDSLEALAIEATGTDIPIPALFQWLRGQPANADGWLADLSQLPDGRLLARRTQPAPAAELRLILEP